MIRFLLVVLVVMGLLAFIFGPGLYRTALFKREQSQLLEDIRQGRISAIAGHVVPAQQKLVQDLLTTHLPADYTTRIESLKLSTWRRTADGLITAVVTCRYSHADYTGIYQGKLVWRYQGQHWVWDFEASEAAEYSLSGEPGWYKLSDVIPLAEQF